MLKTGLATTIMQVGVLMMKILFGILLRFGVCACVILCALILMLSRTLMEAESSRVSVGRGANPSVPLVPNSLRPFHSVRSLHSPCTLPPLLTPFVYSASGEWRGRPQLLAPLPCAVALFWGRQ